MDPRFKQGDIYSFFTLGRAVCIRACSNKISLASSSGPYWRYVLQEQAPSRGGNAQEDPAND
eukprot:7842706-Ditylum_brightwellii.AAC.1